MTRTRPGATEQAPNNGPRISGTQVPVLEDSVGTEIRLDVEKVSLTYSKNHPGMDHGSLYQEPDRGRISCDQLDYDYYKDHGEDPKAAEMAFTRPLKDVVPRLELLGFN